MCNADAMRQTTLLGKGMLLDDEEFPPAPQMESKDMMAALLAGWSSNQDDEYQRMNPRTEGDGIQRSKRYFCRKFFVYNPVRGRCQPTPQRRLLRYSDWVHLRRLWQGGGVMQDWNSEWAANSRKVSKITGRKQVVNVEGSLSAASELIIMRSASGVDLGPLLFNSPPYFTHLMCGSVRKRMNSNCNATV
ncbi:hypothetical protein CAPTEDRAFT_221947 [Capitella teleta]|uniref:Uncharacterized protein n=1 Tax=Capitella teleta TaxID=283909 RepID=R7VGX7_CAPTE|nr:hypothetical protein CAPTEDRAFT_221947 [Capitella teleta]|eukprot:ELU17817.1 hypothetical protein CAPTEDRAFT_221947 [Capitella teleta]